MLIIDDVSISYNKKRIIKNLSLKISKNEIVALLGANGSGKTTLFHAIVGLLPYQGSIYIDDIDVSKKNISARSKCGLGFLPQKSSIFEGLTVSDNILAILEIQNLGRELEKQKLEAVLKKLRLEDIAAEPASEISGGQRRRVEIARAIAFEPKILLLDEPFANLDPLSIEELKNIFKLLKNMGMTLFIVDHNARAICSLVDRIYLIKDGSLFMEGSPEQLMENDLAKQTYFGINS